MDNQIKTKEELERELRVRLDSLQNLLNISQIATTNISEILEKTRTLLILVQDNLREVLSQIPNSQDTL